MLSFEKSHYQINVLVTTPGDVSANDPWLSVLCLVVFALYFNPGFLPGLIAQSLTASGHPTGHQVGQQLVSNATERLNRR